ncbi:MAG: glutamate synthase large subunit [SAR86 cluster bacterium]|uniref:Glutamate synthase [NADPH] large chain n=1 Tax=SAR86 cluster bacterium TaxID=2030880 RepID=A0A2A5B2G6_9GAMM|nr:MAG: glutamate synthase large subunit [SAR86 cluster bacterium]
MSKQIHTPLKFGFPEKTGLYDPAQEKDSCGVGFVANIKGQPSHQIMLDAYHLNSRMDHRGGCGFEANTGDGAGILMALPHSFFQKIAKQEFNKDLPSAGQYAVGNIFLPEINEEREKCQQVIEQIISEESQILTGWREVPTDADGADVGPAARMAQPKIMQLFITAESGLSGEQFERKIYIIRKRFTHRLRGDASLTEAKQVYACSLSTKVIVYKGMLTPGQLFPFYRDLTNPKFETHMAMVHSRFSTNTFPSWDRAQPNRFMSHNGEINTLRGNVNSMVSRQGTVKTDVFGDKLQELFPVIDDDCSDSGSFDAVLEFMLLSGRSLQESVMMMIPEAWQSDVNMDQAKKDFYEYHSALMEPWDGPASIVFSDGNYIGAVLDRNGLRPSRYYVTHDDKVIMASEVGVVHVDPANVKIKGRLQPGKMFLLDFEQGRLIPDEELKQTISSKRPYGEWLKQNKVTLADIAGDNAAPSLNGEDTLQRMQAFGYTTETMQFMLIPMVTEARDPLGSMGNDSALACLSDKPRMIYDYFKQLFAQVTNPAIDSIREEVVMSLQCFVGPEGNLLDTTPEQAHRLSLTHPIISNQELSDIKSMDCRGMKSQVIDTTYDIQDKNGFKDALTRICDEATSAIANGFSFIVLSDRNISKNRIPLSALIACGAVHHHLIGNRKRTQIGLVIETGEAREVHHHCLLTGYGADAINPYLAFEALWQANKEGLLGKEYSEEDTLVAAYKKAVAKGMLKVMAKMGISTLQSYKGAQIFEAVGLASEIVDRCFVGTASRVQGINFDALIEESKRRHSIGFPQRDCDRIPVLNNPGDFHWRSGGDAHMWNPSTISSLQLAARTNSADAYASFAKHSDEDSTRRCTFRGLLKFRTDINTPISVDEVEPVSEIVKRFATGAMSFGSISQESHETLAIAMNRLGGKSNTGEGGEDSARFEPMANGDSKRSAIKQVASGRFGVTIGYLTNADELQIKISQGAKPGEGGELPGSKVDDNIARIRHSTPGVGLISPPPHHDIYSIEDIAQLIHDLKNANREARISVKLVAEIGVGTIAAGVTKAKTDHLVIAGHDGGTGASPLTSIKHAGLPWELGVAETHQTLVMNNLRSRVVLQTDGQLKTGRDIAIAALLGAEEFGFATAPLITLGCIMMRKCHLNTCPVGIATQDPELRKKFKGKPEHVVNYLFMVAEDMRNIMATLGVRTVNEMVGRVDLLDTKRAIGHWKADGLDLSAILEPAKVIFEGTEFYKTKEQDHGLEKALDNELIRLSSKALESGEKVFIEHEIINTNRVVGTMLSNEVAKRWKEEMLPEDTINIKFHGSAGQSLGAWLAKGITLTVEGDANDYVGKGLSGGKIIIYPPKESTFKAEENIISGNVNLYGATSGEAYIRGIAAERFAVRNSGASAVVEGIGDHGCEYMTGGRVVVLGKTGRNFGAGMSGGVAYVWDPAGEFPRQCNKDTFELESVDDSEDILELQTLIKNHLHYTDSQLAKNILENWDQSLTEFVKVMPSDYKRVLAERAADKTALVA